MALCRVFSDFRFWRQSVSAHVSRLHAKEERLLSLFQVSDFVDVCFSMFVQGEDNEREHRLLRDIEIGNFAAIQTVEAETGLFVQSHALHQTLVDYHRN